MFKRTVAEAHLLPAAEKLILTLDEAQHYGLPEELITDLKYGAAKRVQAAALEAEADKLKTDANTILEPALKMLGVFADGWKIEELGEVKSIIVDGRVFTRVVNPGRASLDKDKMKLYLVSKGVSPDLVMAAVEAGTSMGKGSVSVSMGRRSHDYTADTTGTQRGV